MAHDTLDIVEHDQTDVEGVGRCGDVPQVEGRSNEGEPVGEVIEGLRAQLDRFGMLGGEPAVPDQAQVDVGEPGKLTIEQDARAHLDVAYQRLQGRAHRQGVEHPLHRQRGLAAPRCPAHEGNEPRPDLEAAKLAGADRIEGRRLPAQNGVAPFVEDVGGRLVACLTQAAPPSRCRLA